MSGKYLTDERVQSRRPVAAVYGIEDGAKRVWHGVLFNPGFPPEFITADSEQGLLRLIPARYEIRNRYCYKDNKREKLVSVMKQVMRKWGLKP